MSFDPGAFWGERWSEGRIGFHQPRVHPALEDDDGAFLGDGPHRVLVPLSGKSWDLPWLADQGHQAVGVEIVRQAIEELFAEHGRAASIEERYGLEVHVAERIEVWCADFFALPPAVGPFDRVWDRAAIVAVPPDRREDYVAQLRRLAPGARVRLASIDYDPTQMSGPPHAVSPADIRRLVADAHPLVLQHVDLAR
ncbi:MAG: thiopurine S-methyltransferase, partial [Myxococcota bacterium]